MKIRKITNENLEKNAEAVKNHPKYGEENKLIDKALKIHKYNEEISVVAMKIALIDLTNGTNLGRNLGTKGGIRLLAQKIIDSQFDERVKNGDITIVEELARWTKKVFKRNLFSFISKYCLYHNVHVYDRDDYAIYDSVIAENIHKYISKEEYYAITGEKLYKNSIIKLKESYRYKTYLHVINFIIEKNEISVDKPHRKLDWYIWFKNKPKKSKNEIK